MAVPKTILDILEAEQIAPNMDVLAVCEKIKTRHKGHVSAFLYYGSSLRAMNDPEKMLDFYVLVDGYRAVHGMSIRALLNWTTPPSVYYIEHKQADGQVRRCKYSLISADGFVRRCTRPAFLSVVWGRFSQPCVLLLPRDETAKDKIQHARTQAIAHFAAKIAPLLPERTSAEDFWARAFFESYQTELRPEKSDARAREITRRYASRYSQILTSLYGAPNEDGLFTLPRKGKMRAKLGWRIRRIFGKPAAALRILSSAATFDNGLDYVLHKVHSHSGVTIEVSEAQRRHPLLWAPVLGWKLIRKGAFK